VSKSRLYPGILLERMKKKKHGKFELEELILRPRFEISTSRIQICSVTSSPTCLVELQCRLVYLVKEHDESMNRLFEICPPFDICRVLTAVTVKCSRFCEPDSE
jgi:hypothetical protein